MPIRVKCDSCKKTLSVKDHLAGKKIKCPVCQSVVLVSAPAPPPKESASPGDASQAKTATKPKSAKPTTGKPATNGTPANGVAQSNGTPTKPPEPGPAALPPENVEEEALAAFGEDLKPVVDEGPPQTIDFSCPWCDMELHLPADMGGKQEPCPNPECKRIIKIPLPKVTEKKDWRKMDRRGPVGAILNQPEQLDDAWGTVEATKARQASLAQAGAVLPLLLLSGLYMVVAKMMETNEHVRMDREVMGMLKGDAPKIREPILVAEAYRTLGELHLHAKAAKAKLALEKFEGARAMGQPKPENLDKSVHEQMFLLELALAQIELGGPEEEWIAKNKVPWKDAEEEIYRTLNKLQPEPQMLAVREVITRLIERGHLEIANSLASKLGTQSLTGKRPPTFAQQIALLHWKDDKATLAALKLPEAAKLKEYQELKDVSMRVGYAEGFARKGEFAEALALVQLRGPGKDRLEAALGVAAIALADKKNKDEGGKFVKEALTIFKDASTLKTSWQQLQLIRLAARTEDSALVKELLGALPVPFKLRAQLEMFRAHCDSAAGMVDADALRSNLSDEDKEGTTLALAWLTLARHNASKGADRNQNRALFEHYLKITPPPNPEMLRPIVDIGTYQGTLR
jgi:hypothetical protein